MSKALVFGDDTGPCLAVARSLGRRGVEVHLTTSRAEGAAWQSRYAWAVHSLPLYQDPGSAWLARVRQLTTAHSFDILIPTSDSSLAQLLRHKAEIGEACVAVPNAKASEVFLDKIATRALAQELGVPVPRGAALEPDASSAIRQIQLPAVLKRRFSYRCGEKSQKSAVQLAISCDDLQRALSGSQFDLMEEFLPGYCRGLSVVARDGKIIAAHQHRRLRQEHPTGPSSTRASEQCDPQLLEWTQRLVTATELTGVAMFEYRHSEESGETVLLEVNPRFWGSLPLAISCGADFPMLLWSMLVEGRDPEPTIGSRAGVAKSSLKGEQHALSWALAEASSPHQYLCLALRVIQFFLHLARGRRFDSWAEDDPRPFLVERKLLLAGVRSFLAKRVFAGPRRPAVPTA